MEYQISIGTPNACLFVPLSNRLLKELRSFPFLYDAVEEALISAKSSYYSIGIIVWLELLKSVLGANSGQDSDERNIAAHDILKVRPTKKSYDQLLAKFREEARKCYLKEWAKAKDKEAYMVSLKSNWEIFMSELSNNT